MLGAGDRDEASLFNERPQHRNLAARFGDRATDRLVGVHLRDAGRDWLPRQEQCAGLAQSILIGLQIGLPDAFERGERHIDHLGRP